MRFDAHPQNGFTLLELLVVVGIVVMLFFLTLPNLNSFAFVSPPAKVASLISSTCRELKARARKEGKRFRLEIASDTGQIWVTFEGMDKKQLAEAREKAFTVPDSLSISFVSGSITTDKESGASGIFFYSKGYSDPAGIEVREGDHGLLVSVEPLLSQPTIKTLKRL